MQLTGQELADVTAALAEASSLAKGAERRRASRLAVNAPVTIWPIADGAVKPAAAVMIRDISATGVGLLQPFDAPAGAHFAVGLPRPKHAPLVVLCKSVFNAEVADGMFSIGAEYVKPVERSQPQTARAPEVPVPAPAANVAA